jgi:hypothetical protein
MTTPMPVDHAAAAVLLADLERELERADAVGDSGAVARVRIVLRPRIRQLRRALAKAEPIAPNDPCPGLNR